MRICWKLVLILFNFLSCNAEYLPKYSVNRNFGRADDCKPTLEFKNCKDGKKMIYRNQNLRIVAEFKWCKQEKYIYDYALVDSNSKEKTFNNNPGPILFVNKFSLDIKKYTIFLSVHTKGKRAIKVIDNCEVEVRGIPLFPRIKGGFQRRVPVNKEITLDGTLSMDFSNEDPYDTDNLEYQYEYDCMDCGSVQISQENNGAVVKISGSKKDALFLVQLHVRSQWWPQWISTLQEIKARAKEPAITLECLENCYPPFFEGNMTLKAKCENNCPEKLQWYWDLYSVTGTDEDIILGAGKTETHPTMPGPDTYTLEEDVVDPSTKYLMAANPSQMPKIAATYKFETTSASKYSCNIVPSTGGVLLQTKFEVKCTGSGDDNYWRVTLTTDKGEQELQYDSSPDYLSFVIPSHGTLSVVHSQYNGAEKYIKWDTKTDLKIEENILKPESIDELYNKGNESMDVLLGTNDYGAALGKLNLLSKSIAHMNPSDVTKVGPLMKAMVGDLKKIPMGNLLSIQQASSIIDDLSNVNISLSASFLQDITGYCKKLSKEHENVANKGYSKQSSGDNSLRTTISNLMSCSSAAARPNPSELEVEAVGFEVTTVVYLLEEGGANTESYDAYVDDSKAMQNLDQYNEAANDFISICFTNGETLLNRLEFHKNVKDVNTSEYTIAVMRENGTIFFNSKLEAYGVKLSFTKNSYTSPIIYTAVMCITSKKIFWWDHSVDILTDIAIITIKQEKRVLTWLPHPLKIVFKMKSKPKLKFPSKNTARIAYWFRNPIPTRKQQITIYTIVLGAGKSLCIEFTNIEDNATLNVISTDFRLPTLSDFTSGSQMISQSKQYFVDPEVRDYYGFRLIAVLPGSEVQNQKVKYQMTAYAVFCLEWPEKGVGWKHTCKPEFLKEKEEIQCVCESSATLAATMEQIQIEAWGTYKALERFLEEQYFYTVHIFMVVVYLLYCSLLCLAIMSTDGTEKNINFLGDVGYQSRYGYLVIIKTGARIGAGTSANVIIKLNGKQNDSKPHVLNYPDPLMKLLQRGNKDWFFIATHLDLGELLSIELWFDGIGSIPSWYCSYVRIFDIQDSNWYEFKVSCLFRIYPKPRVYCKTKPYNRYEDKSFKTKLVNFLEKCVPDFKIFNLSLSLTDDRLSYVRRLTLMLSIITSIAFWCMCFHGIPKRDATDSVMPFCEFQFTVKSVIVGIVGSVATSAYHIPIILAFMNSKVQFPNDPYAQRRKRPFLLTLICWVLTVSAIIFTSTFVIYYGAWYGPITAFLWMTSISIGFLFYIIVIESVSTFIRTSLQRKLQEDVVYVRRRLSKILRDVEHQRVLLYQKFGKFLLRPFLQHLYSPLKRAEVRMNWFREKLKFNVRELLENLVTFLFYISLLYAVILSSRDSRMIYSHYRVESMMTGSTLRKYPTLEEVISIKTLEDFIENTLIEVTQAKTWYGSYAVRDPGMTTDYNNKIIGVVRFRQHRSEPRSCQVPELMKFLNRTCTNDYFQSQSFKDFGEKWNDTVPPPSRSRMKNVWKFSNSSETGSAPFLGKLGLYSGGGYVAFLGRGQKNSYYNIDYLKRFSWFDELTRSVFIEFLLYNPNFNVFNAVRFAFERSAAGFLKIEVQIETSRMLVTKQESKQRFASLTVLLILFMVLVAVFSIRTVIRIYRTGIWFIKDLWHLVDFSIILLSIACISLFYYRTKKVGDLLESLEGVDPKEFVNYFDLLRVDNTFTLLSSLLIAVATIKLWGLFRFMVVFRIIEKALITSIPPLCAIGLYNVIIIAAFTFVGHVFFVDRSYRFEGFANSIEFLLILTMRPFNEEELEMLDGPSFKLGYWFYNAYAMVVKLFTCIYTAIILIYYAKAQEHYSDVHEPYTVQDYLKDQATFYFNLLKVRMKSLRLSAGQTINELPVSRKNDEYWFAKSHTLSLKKIQAMSLVTLCVLRNMKKKRESLSINDIELMTYTLYHLEKIKHESEEDEEEVFFKGELGGNKYKFVPESQLQKVEAAALMLCGLSKENTMRALGIYTERLLIEENGEQIRKLQGILTIIQKSIKYIDVIMR